MRQSRGIMRSVSSFWRGAEAYIPEREVGSEGLERLTESLGLKYPQDLSEFGAGDLVGGDGEDYVGAAAGGFSEVGVFGSVG